MATTLESIMTRCPVIPVIVIDDPADAVPLAKALVKGGLSVLEVTLRTPHGLGAIRAMKQAVPEAIVGAGTVLNAADVANAVDAGAEFLVSPGTSPGLLDAMQACEVPSLPGVATPSEAMALYEKGFTHLKFFPAQAAGGAAMLKSIGGPLPQLKFCPTGGINPDNAVDYLSLGNVLCVGGSWMLNAKTLAKKEWDKVTAQSKIAASLKR